MLNRFVMFPKISVRGHPGDWQTITTQFPVRDTTRTKAVHILCETVSHGTNCGQVEFDTEGPRRYHCVVSLWHISVRRQNIVIIMNPLIGHIYYEFTGMGTGEITMRRYLRRKYQDLMDDHSP